MKISSLQLFWIMFSFETGNMILLTINPMIQHAKQDGWISSVMASLASLLIVYIAYKASSIHPKQTLIEFSKSIMGKWLGSLIGLSYLAQWYSVIGVILRQFSDFTISILLPSTPLWALVATMLFLMIYVTAGGGVEGIARCSEVFGPIILVSSVFAILLNIPNMEMNKIQPVYMDNGHLQLFKGMLPPLSFLAEAVMLMMFLPFMPQPSQGLPRTLWGVALAGTLVSIVTFSVITTFGAEISAKLRYPAFDTTGFISVMGFIQNIQIAAVLIYILSVFIKLSLYLFIASYGTAQYFGMQNWRKAIWIVSAVAMAEALLFRNVTLSEEIFNQKYWLNYVLPVNMIAIPLVLWIVGAIRQRNQANKPTAKNG